MKIAIIEDELPAMRRLERLILESEPLATIIAKLDSVEDAVAYFNEHSEAELVFMDIQLADGQSFEIFSRTSIKAPVIFVTAFDQYAIKAFKVNSIDYLLKPIEASELNAAIVKFNALQFTDQLPTHKLEMLLKELKDKKETFKKRFLVKSANRLTFVNTEDVAFFFSVESSTFVVTKGNDRFLIDSTLDQVESVLDSAQFFRINRKMIISSVSIARIEPHFNNRYVLQLQPTFDEEIVVSRQRSVEFKEWLDQ